VIYEKITGHVSMILQWRIYDTCQERQIHAFVSTVIKVKKGLDEIISEAKHFYFIIIPNLISTLHTRPSI
jgi:hypothetical protein